MVDDNNYDIDNAWSLFCKYGNINDEIVEHKLNSDKNQLPQKFIFLQKQK